MRLIIVESPNKVAKIQSYAGAGYKVVASSGHIRDLPTRRMGIHIEDGRFEPVWEVTEKAREHVARITDEARRADVVLLATDPDREGEAIAWHLVDACRIPRAKIRRITFNEITKEAVTVAIANPSELDEALVAAAVSRRLIDRFVGYEVSPVLQGLSKDLRAAGRVQTPTLYFVVARERERERFVKKTYWTVGFHYGNGLDVGALGVPDDPSAIDLPEFDDVDDLEQSEPGDERPGLVLRQFATPESAEAFALDLATRHHRVRSVECETRVRYPYPAFTTDSLLAEASRRLRLTAEYTMRLAQSLFEAGLITYHRTDSPMVSAEGVALARETIARWAPDVLPEEHAVQIDDPRAQGAHEGIRPTAEGIATVESADPLDRTPGAASLLRLIAARFVASQSTPALLASTLVLVDAGGETLFARGTVIEDPGYTVFQNEFSFIREKLLPAIEDGESLLPVEWSAPRRETSAPRRYTEATLIEKMHRTGIGRPSTYAATLKSLVGHGLIVERGRDVAPTHAGLDLVDVMTRMLPGLLSPEYTARTEALLDEISAGHASSNRVLAEWYAAHRNDLDEARRVAASIGRGGATFEVVGTCDECGMPVERRQGKYGPYDRCPNGHKPRNAPRLAGVSCPDCGGAMVHRVGASGEFLGCSLFPTCKRTLEITWKPEGQQTTPEDVPIVAPGPGPATQECSDGDVGEDFLTPLAEQPIVEGCPECESALAMTDALGLEFAVCTSSVTCYGCGLSLLPEVSQRKTWWQCQCNPERLATAKLLARASIGHLYLLDGRDRRGRKILRRLAHLTECPECQAALEAARVDDEIVWVCQCGTQTQAILEPGAVLLVEPGAELATPSRIKSEADISCPTCNRPMRIRSGSRGKFLSCSGFPTCRTSMDCDDLGRAVDRPSPAGDERDESSRVREPIACPDCGATMMRRHGASGEFLGCSSYPTCKRTLDVRAQSIPASPHSSSHARSPVENAERAAGTLTVEPSTNVSRGARACAECGSAMQERRGGRTGVFLGCTAYPRCRHTEPASSAAAAEDAAS